MVINTLTKELDKMGDDYVTVHYVVSNSYTSFSAAIEIFIPSINKLFSYCFFDDMFILVNVNSAYNLTVLQTNARYYTDKPYYTIRIPFELIKDNIKISKYIRHEHKMKYGDDIAIIPSKPPEPFLGVPIPTSMIDMFPKIKVYHD